MGSEHNMDKMATKNKSNSDGKGKLKIVLAIHGSPVLG